MKRLLMVAACAATACAAWAKDEVNTVFNAQKERMKTTMPANSARVRAAVKGTALEGAAVVPFAVPAMSDVMRIADVWPEDGRLGGAVRATLAQGEFESGSFELFSFADLDGVELKVSPLVNGADVLSADLRVVKVWFQNGNAWVSYFDDAGLKLCPELLLHDENLVDVDLEKAANYARVMKDGKPTKVWISAPKGLDPCSFNPYDPGFRDAESIQPVKLEKNAFKQFFLTLHAAKNQKPGVYRGKVAVTRKGAALAEVPVAACVLPFALPMPRGYQNYDQLYFYGAMGSMPNLERIKSHCGGDEKRAMACFRNWLQSLYDHSVFHGVDLGPKNVDYALPIMKEIGFPLNPLCGDLMLGWFGLNFGGRMRFDQLMQAKDAAAKCKEFYDKYVPGSEIWCGHGDEQGTAFVTAHREFFKYYSEKGIRIGCAGHDALMIKGGYAYGYYPMGGYPNTMEKARPWHEINGKPVGFYASQHNGSENPQFVRMQHGMLGYLSGLTMTFNYEFATASWSGGWSDRANECYKPMVVTHANGDGLMETLAYAGFREGCDDIRYATYLKGLCREARAKGRIEAKIASEKALQYLALLNREQMDLNVVRAEMIEHILKVRAELGL